MNVCLLLLAEFKKAQRVRMMLHASEAPDFEDRCLTFERSTCTILLRGKPIFGVYSTPVQPMVALITLQSVCFR